MSSYDAWWHKYSDFAADSEQEQYPDPGLVVEYYRNQKGWMQQDLAEKLQLTAKMVRAMEQENSGLDSFERRQQLAHLLAIPRELFGLDAQYTGSIGAWWVREGYEAFPPAQDGYPQPGTVIKFYRQRKRLPGSNQAWTQADLGEALDLSELSIRRMENRGTALDSIARRRALAAILEIPPALLGLDQQARPHSLPIPDERPSRRTILHLPLAIPIAPETDLLNHYQTIQNALLRDALQPSAELIASIELWIGYLQHLAPLVRSEHLTSVLEMEYHYQTVRCQYRFAHFYDWRGSHTLLQRTLLLAQEIEKLDNKQGHDLIAHNLNGQAIFHYTRGNIQAASQAIEAAQSHLKQANPLVRAQVYWRNGLIIAQMKPDHIERRRIALLGEQAEALLQACPPEQQKLLAEKELSLFHQERAQTYLSLNNTEAALTEIERAERATTPTFTARRVRLTILRARAHLKNKIYDYATDLALQALQEASQERRLNDIALINALYRDLKASSYGNAPTIAYLNWQLEQWRELVK